MRRRREAWILDPVSNLAVLACDDPAEQLARVASGNGDLVLWTLRNGEPVEHETRTELAVWHARNAWRFATAALDLYDLYAGDTDMRLLRSES